MALYPKAACKDPLQGLSSRGDLGCILGEAWDRGKRAVNEEIWPLEAFSSLQSSGQMAA
jgi:hypothetical protein